MNKNGTDDLDPKQKKAESKRLKKAKADTIQELDVYWTLIGKNEEPKLAIKLTKGSSVKVILKDPKYLKSLRDHLQTVAKFGLRRNFI